jgi:hypothetical protein
VLPNFPVTPLPSFVTLFCTFLYHFSTTFELNVKRRYLGQQRSCTMIHRKSTILILTKRQVTRLHYDGCASTVSYAVRYIISVNGTLDSGRYWSLIGSTWLYLSRGSNCVKTILSPIPSHSLLSKQTTITGKITRTLCHEATLPFFS